MIDIFKLVKINNPIEQVTLSDSNGYSEALCDYGVLTDNEFLDVLSEVLHQKIESLNFCFFDFVDENHLKLVQSFKISFTDKSLTDIQREIEGLGQRYVSNFEGSVSSRYALFDEKADVIIVVEDSVPLSKVFYRDSIKSLLSIPLLEDFTFTE